MNIPQTDLCFSWSDYPFIPVDALRAAELCSFIMVMQAEGLQAAVKSQQWYLHNSESHLPQSVLKCLNWGCITVISVPKEKHICLVLITHHCLSCHVYCGMKSSIKRGSEGHVSKEEFTRIWKFRAILSGRPNFEECAGCSSPSSYNQCVNWGKIYEKIVLRKNLLKMNSKENGKNVSKCSSWKSL